MTFNNFVKNTKQFFNKKPVRIILAVVVIASIMAAISFGIIELVRMITDPCYKQVGTTWSDKFKRCMKNGCSDGGPVCKSLDPSAKQKVNNCVPKDYCDYKGPEGEYTYDPSSCECKLKCEKGLTPYTNKGLNYTKMIKNPTTDKYEPEEVMQCGTKCDLDKKTGYCNPDKSICGKINIHIKGEDDSKIKTEYTGCLNKSEYHYCPIRKKNPAGPGYVPDTSKKQNIIACSGDVSTSCYYSKTDETTPIACNYVNCESQNENVNENPKVIACKHNSDCGPNNFCNGIIKSTHGKPKFFSEIKYCTDKKDPPGKPSSDKSVYNPNCISRDSIGETKEGDIVDCENLEGVSNNSILKQCSNSLVNGACAMHGICSVNGWQARSTDNKDQYCYEKQGKPPPDYNNLCCAANTEYTDMSGKKMCCGESTTHNPDCLNLTRRPYTVKFLNNSGATLDPPPTLDTQLKIDTKSQKTPQEQIDKLNKQLWGKLGITPDKNPGSSTSEYHTGFYRCRLCRSADKCDDPNDFIGDPTGEYLCAYCGRLNNDKLGVSRDISIGYCSQKDNECKIQGPNWPSGTINLGSKHDTITVPICSQESKTKSNPLQYWSAYNSSGNHVPGLSTTMSYNNVSTTADKCNNDKFLQECTTKYLDTMTGATDVTLTGGKCEMNINCNEYTFDMKDNKNKIKKVKWQDLNNPNIYKEGYNPDNLNINGHLYFNDNSYYISSTGKDNYTPPKCMGYNNNFPKDIVRSPSTPQHTIRGIKCLTKEGINLLNYQGRYCTINTSGNCKKKNLI